MSKQLGFQPLPGLASRHLQMILGALRSSGPPPSSEEMIVPLGEGDYLCCEVSTPLHWVVNERTVILVHGLGGSHLSNYMIRMSRKLYQAGYRVVRVNLRGCGSGKGLSKLPYHGGNSLDLLKIIQQLKQKTPFSELILIGFSLGGNIVLKLMGELGKEAKQLLQKCIAVCPPLDLYQSVQRMSKMKNYFYHSYFLKWTLAQAKPWLQQKVRSIYEMDNLMTAPLWGYKNALEYYQKCSSIHLLSKIEMTTHLLFSEDDPFIDYNKMKEVSLSDSITTWVSKYGSHMGYIGRCSKEHSSHWMDELLMNWIRDNFNFGL